MREMQCVQKASRFIDWPKQGREAPEPITVRREQVPDVVGHTPRVQIPGAALAEYLPDPDSATTMLVRNAASSSPAQWRAVAFPPWRKRERLYLSHVSRSTAMAADAPIDGFRPVMISLASAVFVGAASIRILDALLPQIARFYGQSVGTAGTAVTAYAVSYGICQMFYGPWGDSIGPYRVVTFAGILSAFMAFGCALAPSLPWLVTLRFLAGGVAAAIGPLALAWISHATTVRDRPMAVANMTGASITGTTAGQIGGGLIGGTLSWQYSFILIGMLFAVSGLALAGVGARHPGCRIIGRYDPKGAHGKAIGFLALLRRPNVQLVLAGVGLEGMAMYMSFTYVSALLQDHLRLDTPAIGLLITIFGMGGIIFVLTVRRLVCRFTESRRAIIAAILLAVSFLLLVLVRQTLSAGCALFMLGLGFFMLHNVLQVRATQMAPDAPSSAISLFAGTFFLAQAIGVTIGGWSFDHLGASACFDASAILLGALGLSIAWFTRTTEVATNSS